MAVFPVLVQSRKKDGAGGLTRAVEDSVLNFAAGMGWTFPMFGQNSRRLQHAI